MAKIVVKPNVSKIVVKENISKIVVRETKPSIKVYPDTKVIGTATPYRLHRMAFNTDPNGGGDPPVYNILNESDDNYFPILWSPLIPAAFTGDYDPGITGVIVFVRLYDGSPDKFTLYASGGSLQIVDEQLGGDGTIGELWIIADL